MAQFLKLSTAVTVRVGPIVDATDGGTPETAIALASGEAYLYKHSGAGVDIAGRTWAHTFNGTYDLSLLAGDVDTVGMLSVCIRDAAGRPYRTDYMVVPANVYDSLIGGTDELDVDVKKINGNVSSGFLTGTDKLRGDVIMINGNASSGFLSGTDHIKADVTKISGSAGAADNMEAAALAMQTGTVATGSTTTTIKTGLTEATNDHYNGRIIAFITGQLAGQVASITDYNGTSKDLTVSALTEAPANGDTFIIV